MNPPTTAPSPAPRRFRPSPKVLLLAALVLAVALWFVLRSVRGVDVAVAIANDVWRTRSGPDGNFRFSDLPEGSYSLLARQNELVATLARVVVALDSPPLRVELAPGVTLDEVKAKTEAALRVSL